MWCKFYGVVFILMLNCEKNYFQFELTSLRTPEENLSRPEIIPKISKVVSQHDYSSNIVTSQDDRISKKVFPQDGHSSNKVVTRDAQCSKEVLIVLDSIITRLIWLTVIGSLILLFLAAILFLYCARTRSRRNDEQRSWTNLDETRLN